MAARSPRTAAGWIALLAALLAVAAAAELQLGGRTPWPLVDFALAPLPTFAGIAALFALTELALIHVEFRHDAYSFSLSGIPLLLGVFTGSPTHLVAARVAGALLAFALQRPSPVKAVYNTCAYAFEAATVATLIRLLLPHGAPLDLRTAAVCCLVVPAVDVAMSLLVVGVISLRGGVLSRREIVEILVPAGCSAWPAPPMR